jgi:acetyltransferase-like isoleucine patch superfamily enzyme
MIRRKLRALKSIGGSFSEYFLNNFVMGIPFHFFRRMVLKWKLGGLGRNSTVMLKVEFRNPKSVFIGSNSVVNKRTLLDGRGGTLTIGENVDIAQETNIWTLEHDPHSDTYAAKGADVVIEDFVWIASRCTILPGVRIGRGAVIAANSVVTKDVEPMKIMAGIPARAIGDRKSGLKYTFVYEPWFR